MLTGDNPLTACHVAKELKISTRKTLVLMETNEGVWHWQSIGGGTTVALETRPAELGKNFDLCLTGDVSYILATEVSILASLSHSLSLPPSLPLLGHGLYTEFE